MKRSSAITRIVVWSLVAVISVAAIGGAVTYTQFPSVSMGIKERFRASEEKLKVVQEAEIKEEFSSLDISWKYDEVRILPSEDGKTRLTLKSSRPYKGNCFTGSVSSGTLEVEDIRKPELHLFGWNRTIMEVRVPQKAYERLTLASGSGLMRVEDMKAKVLEAENSSGDMKLLGEFKDLDLMNHSGKLVCTTATGRSLEAENTSGSTSVKGAFTSMELTNRSGNLAALSTAEKTELKAQSTSGGLSADGAFGSIQCAVGSGSAKITSSLAPDTITGEVTSGGLTFAIPEPKAGFQADTTVKSGHFSTHGFSLQQQGDTYLCGRGENSYQFRVSSGSLTLKKQ